MGRRSKRRGVGKFTDRIFWAGMEWLFIQLTPGDFLKGGKEVMFLLWFLLSTQRAHCPYEADSPKYFSRKDNALVEGGKKGNLLLNGWSPTSVLQLQDYQPLLPPERELTQMLASPRVGFSVPSCLPCSWDGFLWVEVEPLTDSCGPPGNWGEFKPPPSPCWPPSLPRLMSSFVIHL